MQNYSINDVFTLTSGKYIDTLVTVDNYFVRQLANLANVQAKQLKYVSFVMKDKVNERGEISKRSIRPDMKSVLDLCKLVPLMNKNVRTLQEEVAVYRAKNLPFETNDAWAMSHKEMLMTDYLLSCSLCYIEVFDGSSKVEKFFATRNRFIAGMITGLSDSDTNEYVSYLTVTKDNYETRQLKALKLTTNKTGFRVTKPRSSIDFFKNNVKVTPLFLMSSFYTGLEKALTDNILRIKYIKDNLVERELVTTMNIPVLNHFYDNNTVQKLISNVETVLSRGYVKLPELGLSKYDETGVRALNISRITSVEAIDISQVDMSYVNVDFNRIIPTFREAIYTINNPGVLSLFYEDLLGVPVPNEIKQSQYVVAELRTAILTFTESQVSLGTTLALQQYHKFMVSRPSYFPKYNGGTPLSTNTLSDNTFNFGMSNGGSVQPPSIQPSSFQRQPEPPKENSESNYTKETNNKIMQKFGGGSLSELGSAKNDTKTGDTKKDGAFFNPFM